MVQAVSKKNSGDTPPAWHWGLTENLLVKLFLWLPCTIFSASSHIPYPFGANLSIALRHSIIFTVDHLLHVSPRLPALYMPYTVPRYLGPEKLVIFAQLSQAKRSCAFELRTGTTRYFALSINRDCMMVESVMPVEAPFSRARG